MIGKTDKEGKLLRQSHLMHVTEFHTMVNALQRFKQDLAVKAITGKKNIRKQQTPDQIFFSVLEKMLLEVSSHPTEGVIRKAEQQLLSLKKVYLWFLSNKQVLVKSDGYFKSARKITEEIYEKQLKSRSRRKLGLRTSPKQQNSRSSTFQTIDDHLEKLHQAEQDAGSRRMQSESSMFAPSPTQDLTSVDSAAFNDVGYCQEDLDFAREVYEHEYTGGNPIERINRPMTAPLRLKPSMPSRSIEVESRSGDASYTGLQSQPISTRRPQSAISQIKHDLSWAKMSPLPLSVLLRRNAESPLDKDDASAKTKINVKIPSESLDSESVADKPVSKFKNSSEATDESRIENLVLFRKFCLEHATQQETYMRQYTHHKHGTRQHFLEFPENKTENAVRHTANSLYRAKESSNSVNHEVTPMETFKEMTLVDFLDRDTSKSSLPPNGLSREKVDNNNPDLSKSSSSVRLSMSAGSADSGSFYSKNTTYESSPYNSLKIPHPPRQRPRKVVQPSRDPVTMSSVLEVAAGAGRLMNSASEQALSAPKHGWRYPMVSIDSSGQKDPEKSKASGVIIALQEDDVVQHKVLIPLRSSEENSLKENNHPVQANFSQSVLPPLHDIGIEDSILPKPSYTAVTGVASSLPSRCSTRPMSSPRYVTEVRAVYRYGGSKSRQSEDERSGIEHHESKRRSLRSAGTSGGASRPRTAASWVSYPSKSEMSRSVGAASHSSTGMLRHRSVAETMKVRSVEKRSHRGTSGRSSASSYVAQLRERKRAGAAAFSQTKTGPRKRIEYDTVAVMEEDPHPQNPHLSFVNIVSPMHVPQDLSHTAYARPGGVYCGTAAVVAIATENPSNVMDDATSDGGLSYEDYSMDDNEEEAGEGDNKPPNDNWLSQWLSGGPLDGLRDAAGNGGATTYADLVSRAAIINSSGDRSYSEEAPSSIGVAQIEMPSPREDFSISPRTDPIISHRTTTDEGDTAGIGEELQEYQRQDADSGEESYSNSQSPLSSQRSSDLSSTHIQDEGDVSDEDNIETYTKQENRDDDAQQQPSSDDENLECFANESETSTEVDQGVEIRENDPRYEVIIDDETKESLNFALHAEGSDVTDSVAFNDSQAIPIKPNKEFLLDVITEKDESDDVDLNGPQHMSDDNSDERKQAQPDQRVVKKTDREKNEAEEVIVVDEATVEKREDINLEHAQTSPKQLENVTTKTEHLNSNDINSETSETENVVIIVNDKLEQQRKEDVVDIKDGSPEKSENIPESILPSGESSSKDSDDLSQATSSDSGSPSESETEILSDRCAVRIVISSARKVERELALKRQEQTYLEQRTLEEIKLSSDKKVHNTSEEQPLPVREEPSTTYDPSHDKNSNFEASSTQNMPDNNSYDPVKGMITYEEMSAVSSLARPLSGRPIPSVVEIRDPFVDMVASTRQRQVDRNVDVPTIFRGNITGDPYKKFDLEQRRLREEEQQAVVKMQRAYRLHLARTRAARKCSGISKETMEWARSYKTMLMEKRETRQRRLRESRQSVRTLQRRDAKRMERIGPHTELYEIFHPGPELPATDLIQESAIEIQRMLRGWLVRRKLKRVKLLVDKRGSTLGTIVREYRDLLQRTQRRHGKLRPSLFLTYEELFEYLNQRAKYELVFKKREFWSEMESSELTAFFNDCDLFPSQDEISEAWDAVSKSMDYARRKKKHSATAMSLEDVLEVAFHIYIPSGARMEDQQTRSSTWMTPICGDEEGLRILNGKDDNSDIESADLEAVAHFVSQTFKDRKESERS